MSDSRALKATKTKKPFVRQAQHAEAIMQSRAADPFVREVAHQICGAVYAGGCMCRSRSDLPACSSMVSAAANVVEFVESRER